MNPINKLFIHTTWACNMNCPRCYIPKDLREDYASRLDTDYLKQILKHKSIDRSNKTIAIYMGGEPSLLGESKLREYMSVVTKQLPNVRHTMVTNLFNLPNWLLKISHNEFRSQIETTYAHGGKQTLDGSASKYQQKFVKNLTSVIRAGIHCTVNLELNIETIQAGIQPIVNIMKQSGARDWAFDYSVNFDGFNNNPIYDRFNHPVLTVSATLKAYWGFVNAITQNAWVVNNKVRITPRTEGYNVMDNHNGFLTINPNNTLTTNALFSSMKQLQYLDIDTLNQSGLREQHQIRAINRIQKIELSNQAHQTQTSNQAHNTQTPNHTHACVGCGEFDECRGFSAHIPIQDGSGLCAGGLEVSCVE